MPVVSSPARALLAAGHMSTNTLAELPDAAVAAAWPFALRPAHAPDSWFPGCPVAAPSQQKAVAKVLPPNQSPVMSRFQIPRRHLRQQDQRDWEYVVKPCLARPLLWFRPRPVPGTLLSSLQESVCNPIPGEAHKQDPTSVAAELLPRQCGAEQGQRTASRAQDGSESQSGCSRRTPHPSPEWAGGL